MSGVATQIENMDLSALLQEVGKEVDTLIKSENEKIEALKKAEASKSESSSSSSMAKAEESKSESSKSEMEKAEESSKSEMAKSAEAVKKDESGSGFESPVPEASAPVAAAPAAENQESGESLEAMVQGLDDDMLHELKQIVDMECQGRQQSQASADQASADQSKAAAPAAPDMGKMEMAYKKEMEDVREKLAKSEEQAKSMEKAFTTMTELIDKMINKPITKAVVDIKHVDFIDKGEKELKKSEQETVSDSDLDKKLKKMATDQRELGKLTKNERDALGQYFVNKKRTPEVLKLINK